MNIDNNNDDIGITVNDNGDTKNVQFSINQSYVYSTPSRDSDDDNSSDAKMSGVTVLTPKSLNEREWLEFMMILVGSVVLAFNAGYVNGCTYQSIMGKGKPTSHVTGTTTKAGLFAADHNFNDMLVNIALIISFCFGSGISGGLLSSSTFSLGLEYGPLFIIGSIMFFVSSMLLFFAPDSYLGFYMAAMACGLQNSLTTTYSGNIIRTTHMTGTVTDIGIVLGKYLVKGQRQDLWKLKILVPLLVSFLIGGVISKYVYTSIGDLAICLSSVFFLIIGSVYSLLVATHLNQSCWKIFLGSYEKLKEVKQQSIVKLKKKQTEIKLKLSQLEIRSPLYHGQRTPL